MRLHEDKDAFRALLSHVGQRANIREDIVEKDISRVVRRFIKLWVK